MLSPAACGRGEGDVAAASKSEDFFFANENLLRRSAPNRVGFSGVRKATTDRSSSPNPGGRNSNCSGKGSSGFCPRTDVVEPQVIDDEALKFAVQELHNDNSGSEQIDYAEIRDFRQVKSLSLSYKNIMFIANLESFTGLRVLRLDNNIIEKIEGLDVLVGLEWLDLSFNNISRITGLTQLVNLTDLSLYANKISQLEGLDECRKLEVLSIGRNNLTDLTEIQYLRRFEHLRCLNLQGNRFISPQRQQQQQQQQQQYSSLRSHQQQQQSSPSGELSPRNPQNNLELESWQLQQTQAQGEKQQAEVEGEEQNQVEGYVAYVLACLPKLKYLDYQLLDKKKLLAAKEAVQPDEIMLDLKRDGRDATGTAGVGDYHSNDNINSSNQQLRESFYQFTYDLQQNLFGDNVVPQAVKFLRDWSLLKDGFVEKLDILSQKLRQNFGQRMQEQLRRISAYEAAAKAAVTESDEEARNLLKQMQSSKKKILREFHSYISQRTTLQQQADAEGKAAAATEQEDACERKRLCSGQAVNKNEESGGAPQEPSLLRLSSMSGDRGRAADTGGGDAGLALKALKEFCYHRAPTLLAAAAAYVKDVHQLHFHLYEGEIALRDSLDEGLDTLEASVEASVKFLLDRGNEYFQTLEEMEKVFSNSLSESAATELEAFALVAADDSAEKVSRTASKKDEVMGACNAFYEQHMQLLMSSEDHMQNTINTWQRRYFETQRQEQHGRSRQRVQQIEGAVEELLQEVVLLQQDVQGDTRDTTDELPALPAPSHDDL